MQVLPINKNFAPSFGEIKSKGNSSEKQMVLVHQIKTFLRTENKDFNNKTPEKYYQRKGYDIGLISLPDMEKVNVSLYKRNNKRETNLSQESFFSRKRTDINDYSSSEELNTKTMKEKYNASRGFLYNNLGVLSFAAAVLLLAGISQIKGAKAAALETSQKFGVTIDSIYNKLENILIKQK